MGAPQGNQFWKLRSKHGRDKLFNSPDAMWEAACEYFEYVDNNPEYESKPMAVSVGSNQGSEIEMAQIPHKQPFTIQGLCLYLGCSSSYFRNFKNSDRGKEEDYASVIEKIEETIYNQKFSGAASGFFNANIIARDLGLADKAETKTEHSGSITFGGIEMVNPDAPKV